MAVQIKTPNITATTDQERLRQIQSYLYQMAGQLQWAFDNIGTAGGSGNGSNYPQYAAAASSSSKETGSLSTLETFSQLKNLIIKSADIVEAYTEAIRVQLEGYYVAQSEFGDYVEQTRLQLEANSQGITQNFTNIYGIQGLVSGLSGQVWNVENQVGGLSGQLGEVEDQVGGLAGQLGDVGNQVGNLSGQVGNVQNQVGNLSGQVGEVKDTVGSLSDQIGDIQDDVDSMTAFIVETNAYIKSGKIDENQGIPVYGLEIGQSNSVDGQIIFSKFARFTSDRLSFYDRNSVEVAYISDYKLYITNAEITGDLWLSGRFKIYYKGGLAFQWIGGET